MYRFYRLDHDEQNASILTEVQDCAIQGDRIPDVADKYANILFHLAAGERITVRREFCDWIPGDVIATVEEFVNGAEDLRALPTYVYDQMLLNGADLVPRLRIVYIAENEKAVLDYIAG